MVDLQRSGGFGLGPAYVREGLRFAEAPPLGKFLVAETAYAMPAALTPSLGHEFPTYPGVIAGREVRSLWTSPGRWFVFGPEAIFPELATAATRSGFTAWNVTDGRTQIDLSGAIVPELLASFTSADLRETAFPPGRALLTQFNRVSALLCRFDTETWSLIVDVSVSAYAWSWLQANADQYATSGR